MDGWVSSDSSGEEDEETQDEGNRRVTANTEMSTSEHLQEDLRRVSASQDALTSTITGVTITGDYVKYRIETKGRRQSPVFTSTTHEHVKQLIGELKKYRDIHLPALYRRSARQYFNISGRNTSPEVTLTTISQSHA